MKKLFLGLAVIAGSFTFAQKASSSSISYGLKAGMNVASLSKVDGIEDQKGKIGFYAGGFVNIPLSSQFSLQPELLFNQVGGKFVNKHTIVDLGTTYNQKLTYTRTENYISVPVMFQYNAMPNLYLEAGPQIGFLVSAKDKIKGENTPVSGSGAGNSYSLSQDSKKEVTSVDFGIGIGAGYYFLPNLGVTARYVAGLSSTNVRKNDNSAGLAKNNVFQIGLAYKF